MSTTLRIATRASALALWQARFVAAHLRRRWPSCRIQLVPLTASGDQDLSTPLYGMGGVGVFCSEVQQAVLDGRADLGVHSLKDLPTSPVAGLQLAAYMRRADPRDALVGAGSLDQIPLGGVVASSSLRRRSQLAALRPDLRFVYIRGNVQTPLRKLADGAADATLLAMAGLARLNLLRQTKAVPLDPLHCCTPAPGQGIIAVDCRSDDQLCRHLLDALDDRLSRRAAELERRVLAGLRGGCSLPLGCYAQRRGTRWHLSARWGHDQGMREIHCQGPAEGLAERALAALQDRA
ncbi:MAG: hydroxymethylbilane synthase [Planctomycetota bacterium]|nr:MAG: hydroxymethylbilane synthase [Planctomycetota bacterium]